MNRGNWDEIEPKLQDELKKIFCGYDISVLSDYEKRRIIFEYLCDNVSYDHELLNGIREFHVNKKPISRDSYLELENVIDYKKGICNGIAQYYKLLLDEVGIKSFCVICDDGTPVKHQLCLVYDETKGVYSFDDVTSVVVKRGTNEEFFDYDLVTANSFGQGQGYVSSNKKWFILPDSYINFLIGRDNKSPVSLEDLPVNISSVKDDSDFDINI